jgi:phosphoserine phosphatase
MTKILLVRHGHVEGIKPDRFRGRADLALTQQGLAEADATARRIAEQWQPIIVYTSPLQRCLATGEAISRTCGVDRIALDLLSDIDYGRWQFKTFDEARKLDAGLFAAWFTSPHLVRFPEGESLQDLLARAADVLRLVLDRHGDQTVVLVGHDSTNRAMFIQLLDQPLSSYWRLAQDPCCINEIDVSGRQICVRSINDTVHLRDISGLGSESKQGSA